MRFILTPHCTTDWNVGKKMQGSRDIGLNDEGRREAAELGKRVQHDFPDITIIVTSPLIRARETAEIINRAFNVPLKTDEYLRECSFGAFEGLTREQVAQRYGSAIEFNYTDYDFSRFGGESRAQVLTRHREFFEDFVTRYPDERPLIVGHRRGLNTLLFALGLGDDDTVLTRTQWCVVEYP